MKDDSFGPMQVGWFQITWVEKPGVLRIESKSTTTLELSARETRQLLILLVKWMREIDDAAEQEKRKG